MSALLTDNKMRGGPRMEIRREIVIKLKILGMVFSGIAIASTAAHAADSVAYETVEGGAFGTVDLNTGLFTDLGSSGQSLSGLAVASGKLFASSYLSGVGSLYTVSTSDGALTLVGTSSFDYNLFGSTTGGGLYAADASGNLYSISQQTGAAALIGPIGLPGLGSAGSWYSLSNNAGALYLSDATGLYQVNTSTGAASLIGSMGANVQMGALVYENGVLWGGQNTDGLSIATLNTTTGAATAVSTVSGSGIGNFFGLAPYPVPTSPVPEPPMCILFGVGLAALEFMRRKRIDGCPS
jgi:hypothetical protein